MESESPYQQYHSRSDAVHPITNRVFTGSTKASHHDPSGSDKSGMEDPTLPHVSKDFTATHANAFAQRMCHK